MAEDYHAEQVELVLYAENEAELYPMFKTIVKQMTQRIEQGKYDAELAIKGWQHWIDKAATRYVKEFHVDMSRTFPAATRRAAAKEVAEREHSLILSGEYGPVNIVGKPAIASKRQAKVAAPKKPTQSELKAGAKFHTKYEGPTDTRGSRIIVTTLGTGKRKTVPYDYAARDAHEAAMREATGSKGAFQRVDDGRNGYFWKPTAASKPAKKTSRKR